MTVSDIATVLISLNKEKDVINQSSLETQKAYDTLKTTIRRLLPEVNETANYQAIGNALRTFTKSTSGEKNHEAIRKVQLACLGYCGLDKKQVYAFADFLAKDKDLVLECDDKEGSFYFKINERKVFDPVKEVEKEQIRKNLEKSDMEAFKKADAAQIDEKAAVRKKALTTVLLEAFPEAVEVEHPKHPEYSHKFIYSPKDKTKGISVYVTFPPGRDQIIFSIKADENDVWRDLFVDLKKSSEPVKLKLNVESWIEKQIIARKEQLGEEEFTV